LVFHRILDFKTGQDFYPALFLFDPISSAIILSFNLIWMKMFEQERRF